jgi:hypothetical protein
MMRLPGEFMPGLKIQQLEKDHPEVFTLRGFIDDLADFNTITTSPFDKVILDLGGILEINSYGVKIWSQGLVEMKNKKVVYRNCQPPIIRQLNVVINLRRNIEIESFYIPYECTSCLIDRDVHCQSSSVLKLGIPRFIEEVVHHFNCPRCDGTMEFMDDETSYFRFLG